MCCASPWWGVYSLLTVWFIFMAWCCVICPSVVRPNTRMTLGMLWITDNDNQTIRPILTQYWFRINIHFVQTIRWRNDIFGLLPKKLNSGCCCCVQVLHNLSIYCNFQLLFVTIWCRWEAEGEGNMESERGSKQLVTIWKWENTQKHSRYWISLCKLTAQCHQDQHWDIFISVLVTWYSHWVYYNRVISYLYDKLWLKLVDFW